MTRQQRMMQRAIQDVQALERSNDDLKNKYGGLCHNFPIMVRQCGLCQAVAFNAAKAKDSGKEKAHKLILEHAQGQLGENNPLDPSAFAASVAGWPTQEYVLNTRLLLQAFAFYKRFAESILHVEASDAGGDAGAGPDEQEPEGEDG